ncbi:MAG: T9SS type A sorting domain-containing protein [Sphingobacteriales bacterium]|nr:T9SS type A sorting domain-containing protein [Sphingobacteriales bacterium]MBI3718935.1 T9SS type A sorting domain-containing protein [Sphingobacteriales bacterium]
MKTSFTLLIWLIAVTGISTTLNAQNPGPKLNSYPSAQPTIYLDFDGETVTTPYWNSGNTLVCASPNYTDAQITVFFNKVAEDYRPFNINVTTDSAVYAIAPANKRIRVIVTPTYQWYGMAGGVSYVGSFRWGNGVPAFVFSSLLANGDPNLCADAASHEAGHSLGLNHQSKFNADCSLNAEYNPGTGTGQTSWAPIMGKSYYKTLSLWYNGPSSSNGCNSSQDDMSIISNVSTNGTGYRTDGVGDNKNSAAAVNFSQATQAFSQSEMINTNTDVDFYSFIMPTSGTFKLSALPFNAGNNNMGANLDIKVNLYKSNGTLLKTYVSATTLDATVDTALTAGSYYLSVNNTTNANTPANYGIVGAYTMNGSYIISSGLPIYALDLSGIVQNNEHQLSWKIIADEPIKNITVEQSKDGKNFSTLYVLDGNARNFASRPFDNSNTYYRLKAVTEADVAYFSNIISLKGIAGRGKFNILSNVVRNDITVLSDNKYQYRIADISGKVVATGMLNNGTTRISLNNAAHGMYFLQVISDDEKWTEKFIKQ